MSKRTPFVFRPGLAQLESREVPAVASVQLNGGILTVACNNSNTTVLLVTNSAGVFVQDVGAQRFWSFAPGQVGRADIIGGAGNDTFTGRGATRTRMIGNGGGDRFYGGSGRDVMIGGNGHDRMYGRAGNDHIDGGFGNDYADGGAGDEIIQGGDGKDTLNGGAGADALSGDVGDDVLVAIDNTTQDTVDGGGGVDVIWVDRNGVTTDLQTGVDASDFVRAVASFANGADRTLDGDRIDLPTTLTTGFGNNPDPYEPIVGRPLFSTAGPALADIVQRTRTQFGGGAGPVALGDGWLLAGLGAVVDQDPNVIRANVVDFGDTTYGVHLEGQFYRVDNRLPTQREGDVITGYAALGVEGSLWVAVVEKAFAHHHTGADSYDSLDGTGGPSADGFTTDAFAAFGFPVTTSSALSGMTGFTDAQALGDAIRTAVDAQDVPPDSQDLVVTITIQSAAGGSGLVNNQAYAVLSYTEDNADPPNVATVTLRDPRGGTVVVTPAQLFASIGTLDTGAEDPPAP
jgi:hypothetical protein